MRTILTILFIFVLSISTTFAHNGIDNDDKAAKVIIEGIVIDQATGEPLEGAKVYVQNSSEAVYANQDGFFRIEASRSANYKLNLQLISYEKLEMKLSDTGQILVCTMQELD